MIKELHNILDKFTKPSLDLENEIHGRIKSFIKEKFKDNELPENSPLNYEAIAFAYPDIRQITSKMLSYWEKRSSEARSPILQCHYAELVWEFSPKVRSKKADISIAYKFIDSIIKMAKLGGDKFLKYKLERALRLAVSINNKNKILSLRDAIINYEDIHSEDDKSGTWSYSFDLLIGDKDLYKKVELEKEQENKIIKKLEERLTALSDKDSKFFNPYDVEHVISKLAPYYRDQNERVSLKRVLLIYRDSFLSDIEKGAMILGSGRLEKVRNILLQYGLSQEAKGIEKNLRKAQKEDLKLLRKHKRPVRLPKKEEIDNYIKKLDEQSLSHALQMIAISFIPDKDRVGKIILKDAKISPLLYMIPTNVIDYTGRKISEIGPLEKDLDGHIIHQLRQSLPSTLPPRIELGLNHLEKTKSLNANTLSNHLFKSPFFLKEYHQIVKEGLDAYFNKKYIASCSILIPQIETAIREIIAVAGGEIYQSSRSSNEKGFNLRPLSSLLRDEIFINIFEKFNKNIPIYFQILLTDKRGFNFRNDICHGHFPSDYFGKTVANYIIHIFLILSILRKSENKKS